LGIKRGTSVVPSETYFGWNDIYNSEDMKLVCLYEMRQDQEYKKFEINVLLKHTRLHDYKVINKEQSVFIFDFSDLKEDWNHLINGRYSKLSKQTKETILGFFEQYSGNYVYINSYLNPDNWFERYAEILGVDKKLLEEVGELCDKPDLNKECLLIVVANLENINILD
jgi:hypothetical protein